MKNQENRTNVKPKSMLSHPKRTRLDFHMRKTAHSPEKWTINY